MKKIYLTEQQLNYLIDCEVITESNILQTIFSGCNTYEEKVQRVILLAKKGIITMGLLSAITLSLLPNSTKEEQEAFKEQIEKVIPEQNKPVDNNVYANNFELSESGIDHIMSYEKKRLDAYYATNEERERGILTVGVGHKILPTDSEEIKRLKEGDKITVTQMNNLFKEDITTHVRDFQNAVKRLPKYLQNPNLYTQGFIDAAISLTFNAGQPNMMASDFFKTWKNCRIDKNTGKIRLDDYNYTVSMLKQSCIKQKGKILNGLVDRRNKEYKMASLK